MDAPLWASLFALISLGVIVATACCRVRDYDDRCLPKAVVVLASAGSFLALAYLSLYFVRWYGADMLIIIPAFLAWLLIAPDGRPGPDKPSFYYLGGG